MLTAGLITAYGYDPAANLTTTTLPAANGYIKSRTYDRSKRLTEVKNQKGALANGARPRGRAHRTASPVGRD